MLTGLGCHKVLEFLSNTHKALGLMSSSDRTGHGVLACMYAPSGYLVPAEDKRGHWVI